MIGKTLWLWTKGVQRQGRIEPLEFALFVKFESCTGCRYGLTRYSSEMANGKVGRAEHASSCSLSKTS